MKHLPAAAAAAASPSSSLHDWLSFGSGVIASIAWPATALILIFFFRLVLKRLVEAFTARIAHMTQVKLPGGIEGTFADALQKTADDLGQAEESGQLRRVDSSSDGAASSVGQAAGRSDKHNPPESRPEAARPRWTASQALPPANLADVEHIAVISPSLAVVQAFLPVESAARRLLDVHDAPRTASTMLAFLRAPYVPESLKLAARRLNELRNRAAHEPDLTLTASAAVDFARTAEDVVLQINRLIEAAHDNTSTRRQSR